MLTNNIITQNRVYAPIIVGFVILLSVFIFYPLYTEYIDTSITIKNLENTKSEKWQKVNEIKKIQALFAGSGSSEMKEKIEKYNHSFNTSDIMESIMINNFTKNTTLTPASISIGSISVDKGKKLPNGLSLANVSISITADTPDLMVDFLTYLVTKSRFAFTFDSISLPLDTSILPQDANKLSLSISLWAYYYE